MPNSDEIHHLATLVERLTGTADDMDKLAVADRHHIQVSINDLQFGIRNLNEKLEHMADIVAQQSSIIRSFEDERQRQTGAKGAIKLIWGIVATGVAGVAYSLHDIVQFFFPPKH